MIPLLSVFGGLVALVVGAELLLHGASRLASSFGVTPLVAGLTVVAYGTCAPAFVVTLHAASSGMSDVALGNIVGCNIFNILFILGASALMTPLFIVRKRVRSDILILIGVSTLFFLMSSNGVVGRFEGIALIVGCIVYTWCSIRLSREEKVKIEGAPREETKPPPDPDWLSRRKDIGWIVAGVAVLMIGSRFFVDGAVQFATMLGLSDFLIGLTVIAAGTSLPTAATSIVAAIRGEQDLAVGTLVGSNIVNLLGVLGVSALFSRYGGINVPENVSTFDIPVLLLVTFSCLSIFLTGYRAGRREGAMFLAFYVSYLIYLVMSARAHPALSAFSSVMSVAIPLAGCTLAALVFRSWRKPVV